MEQVFPPFADLKENVVYEIETKYIIKDDDFNCRGTFSPLEVFELAVSIKKQGLISPIVVQPYRIIEGKYFKIIAGHRRFVAKQLNEALTIGCLAKLDLSAFDAKALNLTENTERSDLNIAQEAKTVEYFLLAGWSNVEIGRKINRDSRWVKTRADYLRLPPEQQKEVLAGLIPQAEIAHLVEALDMDEDVFHELLKKIKDAKLNGKTKTKTTIKQIVHTQSVEKRQKTIDELIAAQGHVQEQTGDPKNLVAIVLGWAAGYVDEADFQTAMGHFTRAVYKRHYILPGE